MTNTPGYPDSSDDSGLTAGSAPPGTPRWVKVFGIIAIVVAALFIGLMIFGGGRHGPGRHLRSGDAVGETPSGSGRP